MNRSNTMMKMFSVCLAVAAICCAAAPQAGLTLVSPAEGEAVCLLNDGNRAFLEMDAAARRRIFTDKAWRHEAAKKWRSLPKPVTLKYPGATMKEKCENYVKSLGFTDADIAAFRRIMLED